VKTTLDLPEELVRAVKIRAVHEGRRLKDVMADLIRHGLAHEGPPPSAVGKRVQLPLMQCSYPADPEQEMTPDRVADVLQQEDTTAVREAR
jgi:plasmid stability protein